MFQLFGKFSDMSKVELALVCDAVEYGEIVPTTKASQKQLSILTFAVKASPTFVRLSLLPRGKRPLKFQVSYTVERKLEIQEFALCHSQYSNQQITDAFGMPQLALLQARV